MLNLQHNLVSILYTIREMSQSCLEQLNENPMTERAAQSALDRISRQADRALEITKRLKCGLRSEEKLQNKGIPEIIIRGEWKKIVDILRREFSLDTLEIIERIPNDFPAVICHPSEFFEILYHLSKNAIQAMFEKKDAIGSNKLILRAQIAFSSKEEPYAVISISDTGPGISQENLKQLFRPFFTTKPDEEGNGLGLYLTRELVLKNSGRIFVSSFSGAGTTFTLEFPIV